ncbi:MAG: hypothetical protein IPJ41_14535 [Phycisphaerales bacterium]|nr:hypothetical protein [Phycisphaerales bacterium]
MPTAPAKPNEAAASSPAWARIAGSHELLWLGFDADAYELPRTAALGEAAGASRRTSGCFSFWHP